MRKHPRLEEHPQEEKGQNEQKNANRKRVYEIKELERFGSSRNLQEKAKKRKKSGHSRKELLVVPPFFCSDHSRTLPTAG